MADILSDYQRDLFLGINFVGICGTVSLFGVAANGINLIVFLKQGFGNTINICFFGLAISDMCCLLTLLWMGVCLNPLIIRAGAPWVPADFAYLTGAWPHNISGRITSYITVYVTAERCMCIIFPLKVKQLITPGRTTVAVCLIYALNIITLVPEYATAYLSWKYFPGINRSLLTIFVTKGRDRTSGVVFFLNSITGITSFVSVIIFTVILVAKLKQASIWRMQTTSTAAALSSDGRGGMANRDKKTVKMIAVIAAVLIACFTPGAIVSMVTFIEPEFDLRKKYVNITVSMWSVACIFQSVNSSINIILYYKMSSKYRQTLTVLLARFRRNNVRHISAEVKE